MSATITINFAGATATTNIVQLLLGGATISPGAQNGVVVAMASALTNIIILAGEVSVSAAPGARFEGSIAMAIAWQQGAVPALTLDNFEPAQGNPATVTWPTETGPRTQILTPGDPMPLDGIVAS